LCMEARDVSAPTHRRVRAYTRSILLVCTICTGTAIAAIDAPPRYGHIGEPVHLTVGYQPYYAEAWSAAIVRSRKFYDKYLPPGSSVQFKVGTKGAGVLVTALRKGEDDISYLSIAPTLSAIQEQNLADLRAVAVAAVSADLCNVVIVRPDAPAEKTVAEQVAWLADKRLAVPSGTCADVFVSRLLSEHGVHPAILLDQNIDVLPTSWRMGKLDAAAVWEPEATQLIDEGLARRMLSGTDVGRKSASFVVVRAELLRERPDVAHAWLETERDAQVYLADSNNAVEVVRALVLQTGGLPSEVIHKALYGGLRRTGASSSSSPVRAQYPFVFTDEVMGLLADTAAYMAKTGRIGSADLRAGAIEPDWARAVSRGAATDHRQ
jgi:NitT/TauT family transport system substrate-binding protein